MPFTKFDAILFDKDGTIFDSEQACCDAWLETAQLFGVHFSTDMFKQFIGIPTEDCYKMAHQGFGSAFPMDEFILETRRNLSARKQQGLPIKKGFTRFFKYIQQHKIPVGVVTSSNYASTVESFQHTDYMDALDVLITFDDIDQPKPAADCYLLACEKLAVSPERVLVFEDSNAGLKASLAAGCYTVAIPDLADIEPELLAQSQHALTSFDEVYAILD